MTVASQAPIGTAATNVDLPIEHVQIKTRMVTFVIYCAPLDQSNPMYRTVHAGDTSLYGVTDSASYLIGMPYVVVDADTNEVIFPIANSRGETAKVIARTSTNSLNDGKRSVHTLPAIHIPDHVTRIALHIANDAFHHRRKFQLFPWAVPDAAHSKVDIYELRSDLRAEFIDKNELGNIPQENALLAKKGFPNEYIGLLTGDLWLSVSHEFNNEDIHRLCPPEKLSRKILSAQSRQSSQPEQQIGQMLSGAQPQPVEDLENLDVDWTTALGPIYSAGVGSRSMDSFSVTIQKLGITLTFSPRALANAINTSEHTTVQQALRRTSPRTFAALLKASWQLHIDQIALSSSWRPMLGSRLHKMGVGLDVVRVDDTVEKISFTIRNRGKGDRGKSFPDTISGKKMSDLYKNLNRDSEISPGAVYTPWVNWVIPHDTHMHITVKDE
jgi:hypothetical protein